MDDTKMQLSDDRDLIIHSSVVEEVAETLLMVALMAAGLFLAAV